MLRICHVQVLPILSGVQRAMLEIFDQLDRRRYEIHVACKQPGPLSEELARRDIQTHFVPHLDRPIRPWRDLAAVGQLRRLFQKHRFDLVHTHSSKPGIVGRLAAHQAGVKRVVHTVQGFAFHEFTPRATRWAYARVERWAAPYCHKLIFVNHEEREMILRERWAEPERCVTIYNGVDLDEISPRTVEPDRSRFRRQHGLAEDEVAVLFSARLDYQKQPLILPEITARLNRRRPSAKWRLLIAGSGTHEARVRQRVAELGLDHRVTFLGWSDDRLPALRAADIALLPSLFEGIPLGLLESHAVGIPSVASRARGNREAVTAETGRLCEISDADDYAAALAELVDKPELRHRMGKAARQRADKHFDTAENSRRIIAVYEELLGTSRTTQPLPLAA